NINPTSGTVGTIVTIEGTNFSATPSNNVVRFNGTDAAVSSSSATTLTTVVPSGATTGRVSVSVNSLTVTSSFDFTVLDSTPPFIENNTASSYLQNESIRITAALLDVESGIASATLRYRFISAGGSFLSAPLLSESGSNYSYTIPANPNETLGVEYEFQVTNGAGQASMRQVYTIRTSVAGDGVEIPYESPGTSISNYRIVAVPLELSANSVASVFDELGPIDDTRWRMSYFDNGVNRELTPSSPIVPGKGYWIIAKDDPGTIRSGAGTAVHAAGAAPFELTLASGWNQIGNPYAFNIRWSDVQQANPGLSGLRKYDGTFVDGSVLNKMEGGFVFSPSANTIVLPVEKNLTVNNGRQIDLQTKNALSGRDWQVYLWVKKGELENRIAGLGMNEKASDGLDPFDGVAMPHLFKQWLDVRHSWQDPNGVVVTKDIVPNRENHTWEFTVEASDAGGTMVLEWDNSYFGEAGPEIFLWDYVANQKVNMRREKLFEFNNRKSNVFKVVFGTAAYVKRETIAPTIALNAWPNPAQKSGNVTVGLSIPETHGRTLATIRVVNVLGQTIWETTREVTPGENEETWNMSGNETPGVYLVTATVGNHERTVRIAIH
ncbi:MAG: IPT/TIG domain-containing protein, partial [Bacteroidota bacterium]